MADPSPHKSGFVNIIGNPNMGKSTLLNALVGERMSIITPKPQTTRHRLIAIMSGEHFQIVFSDTPGYIDDPAYKMHKMMNAYVSTAFEDADIIIYLTDPYENLSDQNNLLQKIASHPGPVLAVLNKKDLVSAEVMENKKAQLAQLLPGRNIHVVSALKGAGVLELMSEILNLLPEGPPFYPPDQLTDRPERFFVSEIIREKILEQYRDEIPYTCEVAIQSFSEGDSRTGPITRITAIIFTMDERKKSILLGKNGAAIKELGTAARKEIETFLGKRVFLELTVRIRDNWRDDDQALKSFGYQN